VIIKPIGTNEIKITDTKGNVAIEYNPTTNEVKLADQIKIK
jgi:hypothetical protein